MKKKKKHSFKYIAPDNLGTSKAKTEVAKKMSAEDAPLAAIRDFKRAGLTIIFFIALIILTFTFRDKLKLEELIRYIKY